MISIGINGFGRIGKLLFLQLIQHKNIKVSAINAPDLDIKNMETYLKYDSVHRYDTNWQFKIIDDNNFMINDNIIHVFRSRNATDLDWKSYNINYVIDATGSYLTTPKCQEHNVDYVIMCSPPKDNSPLFVYGVNHENYNGQKIVSNASCTTNSITPVLKFLDDKYKINNANFTTIHSATASQFTVDTKNLNNRTHRSILNNIIPHSTDDSSSISLLIPSLTNKVFGTSLIVPVSNVSMVDLNIELESSVTFDQLMTKFEKDEFIQLNKLNLVSTDFLTTNYPSIIDKKASIHLGGNRFKLMIWYDNEWSYAAQVIRLSEHMISYNNKKRSYIDNYNFNGKNVLLRVDWNIPTKDFKIMNDYRIISSLPTIEKILRDGPNRLIIMSHFGRPKGITEKYSLSNYLEQIQQYFNKPIHFLKDGLRNTTLEELGKMTAEQNLNSIYLLENLRFHDEETDYKKYLRTDNEAISIIQELGNIYVNDAFSCMHRDHLSICGIKDIKDRVYGYLVQKELDILKLLTENKDNKKILAIIGGAKIHDKLPMLESLSKKINAIYIGGGNINSILKNNMDGYIKKISENNASIYKMHDGMAATDIEDVGTYTKVENLEFDKYFYDIGLQSLIELKKLIQENDIIFWNGTLGVVEKEIYKFGSELLVNSLIESGKTVIIGGGDTSSFVSQFKHNFYFISTGGCATIDYISNGSLVGIEYFNH